MQEIGTPLSYDVCFVALSIRMLPQFAIAQRQITTPTMVSRHLKRCTACLDSKMGETLTCLHYPPPPPPHPLPKYLHICRMVVAASRVNDEFSPPNCKMHTVLPVLTAAATCLRRRTPPPGSFTYINKLQEFILHLNEKSNTHKKLAFNILV